MSSDQGSAIFDERYIAVTQRVIDIIVAILLLQGDLSATGILISRTGTKLNLSGPALEKEYYS